MSNTYEELKNVILLCADPTYKVMKEYFQNVFPNNKIVILTHDYESFPFEEGKHYLCVRHVPRFSELAVDVPRGSWRYIPIIDREERDNYDLPRIAKDDVNRGVISIVPKSLYAVPLFPKNCKVSFLNTEHFTDKYILGYARRYIPDTVEVYDYSMSNIEIFGRGKYLPYKITAEETLRLQKFLNVKKEYDVCIAGTYSKRRKYIYYQLKRAGLNVLLIGGIIGYAGKVHPYAYMFGDERDALIGKAKVLLNIHLYKTFRIYEAIRCDRWHAAGMPVISERSYGPATKGVIEVDYDRIVETVLKELAGPGGT